MPVLTLVNKTMPNHLTEFYDAGSVFVPNKFMVGFYGPYLEETMNKLEKESRKGNNYNSRVTFERFKSLYYDERNKVLDLKWLCSKVSLPTPTPVIETSFNVDTIKGIKYPLIRSYSGGASEIMLSINEDRHLNAWQFFNTLMNRFFIPQILKPRSSFQKLSMYVAAINGDYTEAGTGRDGERYGTGTGIALDDIPLQVYEFNSIVINNIGKVDYENGNKNTIATFNVSFQSPDAFQGAYNSTFKGLRDNTSNGIITNDAQPIRYDSTQQKMVYNESFFEVDHKSTSSGLTKELMNEYDINIPSEPSIPQTSITPSTTRAQQEKYNNGFDGTSGAFAPDRSASNTGEAQWKALQPRTLVPLKK